MCPARNLYLGTLVSQFSPQELGRAGALAASSSLKATCPPPDRRFAGKTHLRAGRSTDSPLVGPILAAVSRAIKTLKQQRRARAPDFTSASPSAATMFAKERELTISASHGLPSWRGKGVGPRLQVPRLTDCDPKRSPFLVLMKVLLSARGASCDDASPRSVFGLLLQPLAAGAVRT